MKKQLSWMLFLMVAVGLSILWGCWPRRPQAGALPPFEAPALTGIVEEEVDGDTIKVRLDDGTLETLRYLGINAPELGECYAEEATEINRALVIDRRVWLETDQEERDQYDRLLAYVYLDNQGDAMVNLMLLAIGAVDIEIREPNTRYEAVLVQMRDLARQLNLGLWSRCVAQATVRITRVYPNPPGGDRPDPEPWKEWIEICNKGGSSIDISGWSLTDEEGFYYFPSDTVLNSVGEETACLKVTGREYNPSGDVHDLFLSNSGDEVILRNKEGKEVDRCEFGKTDEDVIIHCSDP